mmetsp:Transcript_40365/g.111198  ORF Transcript_40365/g.111198 Transcript_40365/m.111198 type:complete len:304 (+) Transcript_40365:1054-1965(+)
MRSKRKRAHTRIGGNAKFKGVSKRRNLPMVCDFSLNLLLVITNTWHASSCSSGFRTRSRMEALISRLSDWRLDKRAGPTTVRSTSALETSSSTSSCRPAPLNWPTTASTAPPALSTFTSSATDAVVINCRASESAIAEAWGRCKPFPPRAPMSKSRPWRSRCVTFHSAVGAENSFTSTQNFLACIGAPGIAYCGTLTGTSPSTPRECSMAFSMLPTSDSSRAFSELSKLQLPASRSGPSKNILGMMVSMDKYRSIAFMTCDGLPSGTLETEPTKSSSMKAAAHASATSLPRLAFSTEQNTSTT